MGRIAAETGWARCQERGWLTADLTGDADKREWGGLGSEHSAQWTEGLAAVSRMIEDTRAVDVPALTIPGALLRIWMAREWRLWKGRDGVACAQLVGV